MQMTLTPQQLAVVESPPDKKLFLEGPAGTGKTTAGVARMLHWIASGVPASRILVIVPQRTLAEPYYAARHHPDLAPDGQVEIATVGGLAQRMVDLFWPLVVEEAGFGLPTCARRSSPSKRRSIYMARIVAPLVDQATRVHFH
jgi:hypothetical protein